MMQPLDRSRRSDVIRNNQRVPFGPSKFATITIRGHVGLNNKTTMMLALLAGVATSNLANAQISAIPGVGFKIGDDVATVKAALKTNLDPEPMERNPALPSAVIDINKGKTVLHLRTKGIWAFFTPSGTVEVIRLDAPFPGDVLGIRLGDDAKKVMARLWEPHQKAVPCVWNDGHISVRYRSV